MELYICDFTKNKDCGHGCVYFGGLCAATTKAEYAMSKEDILNLPAEDFMRMHDALPDELKAKMLQKDWYWSKRILSYRVE